MADVVFMIDTSRSSVDLDLPGCQQGVDDAPVLMKTFMERVVENFSHRALLAEDTGGGVRVSAITYNQMPRIDFGFESNFTTIRQGVSNMDITGANPSE